MDPLSITASAIAIVQLSGAIINTCYTYRSRLKSASKNASRIINELNSLRMVIESLFQVVEDESETKSGRESTLSKLSQRGGPLANCETVLQELSMRLEPKAGWRAVQAAILWPLTESDMRTALKEIGSLKSIIQLALDVDQRSAASNCFLRKGLLRYWLERQQPLYKRPCCLWISAFLQMECVSLLHFSRLYYNNAKIPGARREKIFTWLGASSAMASHNAARQKYRSGTGQWFLEGDTFKTWAKSSNPFLWIHGIGEYLKQNFSKYAHN
jgi:hypothetical protein